MKVTINITKRRVIQFVSVFFVLLFTVFIFLYFQEYSMSELTGNEISDLKQIETENIFIYKTTDYLIKASSKFRGCECSDVIYLQPDYMLKSANEIVTSKKPNGYCCGLDFYWIKDQYEKESIQIEDKSNQIWFILNNNQQGITYDYLVKSNMYLGNDGLFKPREVIKIFVKQILQSHEFTLLKTPYWDDYLIKDLGDKFLIYTIRNHIEDPYFINIQLYSKRKYFTDFI